MIDSDGFRPNVGIILANEVGQVMWARRINQDAWQFPQGGINPQESPEEALFRELNEEVGLEPHDVRILACTRGWLRYRLPQRLVRTHSQPLCIGQKQKWFLLRLTGDEQRVRMDLTGKPEFDGWRWSATGTRWARWCPSSAKCTVVPSRSWLRACPSATDRD